MTPSEQVKNFVAMPRTADIHIQKIAPGPPATIAKATPAILPSPIVFDRAAASAWKCDSSPCSSGVSKRPAMTANAWPK
ncbi:MAG: Uncharacterised protein [Halieaceae bacterium]|nr:MAG: Uncharacterised protein [Halieaceae bacterium]